jgi:hypothetical protein
VAHLPPAAALRRQVPALHQAVQGPVTVPDALRLVQAVEVLEPAGTAEVRLTREAKAALERLARQH